MSSTTCAKITIAISPQCPYFCPNNELHSGYLTDILKKALAPEEVKFIRIPEGRLKDGLNGEDYDFALLPSVEIIRENNLYANSPPLGFHFMGKATKDIKLLTMPIAQIKKATFVIRKTDKGERIVKKRFEIYPNWKTNHITYLTGNETEARMLKMLKLKRADLVFADFYALSYQRNHMHLQKRIHISPTSLAGFTPIILVHKGHEDKQVYNKVALWLESSRKSGELNRILKHYFLKDWDIYNTRF